jgi:hypothetical protein
MTNFKGDSMKKQFKHLIVSLLILIVTLTQSSIILAASQVNVKSVKLNKSSISIEKGKTFSLKASFSPTNASNKQVSWKSANSSIAKVNSKGIVTAVKVGTTSIKVTTKNGNKTAKCTVKVTDPVDNQAKKVQYISDREVYYEEIDSLQRLFFSFKDKNNNRIKSAATVEIKIINDNNETVYSKTKNITAKDFGYWSDSYEDDQLLCSIDIKDSSIYGGTVSTGKIYFSVYYKNIFYFDVSKLSVENLPLLSLDELYSLTGPDLPFSITLNQYGEEKSFDFTDGQFKYEDNYDGTATLHIYFTGEKTYDSEGSSITDAIPYKLYRDGYVVDSGYFNLEYLSEGDAFSDAEITVYDLEPGDYEIKLFDVNE